MLKKVEEFIRENQMISPGDRVVAGVSGGADSVCLLDILNRLSKMLSFSLEAVHVNHMIRGEEANRDEEYVKNLCRKLQVPLRCIHRDIPKLSKESGESLEEAGRRARYEAFYSIEGVDKIAVAHHADDQAETVLYNIFRGSSLKGAGGMRPVRDKVIRPLLCVSRKEIEDYLSVRNMTFCTDSTNFSNEYTRNKIRNDIIPLVREAVQRDVVSNLNDFSQDMRESYEYIRKKAEDVLNECRRDENTETGQIILDGNMLLSEPSVIRREVIMLSIRELSGTLKNITRKHISSVEELLTKPVSRQTDLPYGIVAVRDYDSIILRKKDRNVQEQEENPFVSLKEGDFEFEVLDYEGNWEIITNDYTKVFDYDKIKGNVKVRKRMPGDYIILDGSGNRKLLKSYFIDEKIPRRLRDKIWLLAEDSHVLWIVGYRISAAYKADGTTKRILKATIRRKRNGI